MRVPGRSFAVHGRVFSIFLAACLLASCGSSGNDSTGPSGTDLFYQFKANGTLVKFTNPGSLWATFATSGSQNTLVISGFDANSNSNLQIYSDQTIGAGTYTGFTSVNAVLVGVLIGYQDTSNVDYVNTGSNASDATIVITDVTSTRVSGTFFGVLKAQGHPDVTITEGQFVVQRTN
jgi:hypothetical protein